MADSAGNGR
ncbi:hypothetical protein AVEN_243956-1, partial [Araneus ventricosus]